ncbi:MAG: arsenate reductase ArsC [Spirochaetaceae bacterium]|nr:arsenate reductase ArsC [Spirochaetaceae bacterium]
MAEGFAQSLKSHLFDAYSAGVEKHGMNPYAVKVMAEADIDISCNKSKTTDELPVKEFDYVVTVCDNARERCPWFPAKTKMIHRSFDDPPFLTRDMSDSEEKLDVYRRVRDEIHSFVENILPGALAT